MKRGLTAFTIAVLILFTTVSLARAGGFYFNPSLGAAIPTEGSTKPSVGAGLSAGYEFTSYLAAGLSYRFLYAAGDQELNTTHMYDLNATLFKRLPVITPYFRLGAGAYTMTFDHLDTRTDPLFNVGAGVHLHPIPFIGLTAGVTYHVLVDATDFIEPLIYLGFSLGK